MKVKMKRLEKEAINYAKVRFSNKGQWAENCISKDAFLAGYRLARELIEYNGLMVVDNGQEEIEIEFKDGEHQL